MNWTTGISSVAGAAWSGSAKARVRVEKASAGSGLHNRSEADKQRRESAADRIPQQSLSRTETETAPRWHGMRLSAPFVAQILGQVLPQSEPDALSARAAYGHAGAWRATGIRLDRDV